MPYIETMLRHLENIKSKGNFQHDPLPWHNKDFTKNKKSYSVFLKVS